jgi:hypothetical protein
VPSSEDSTETVQRYKHATASLYSKATFFWLTPLLWVGYINPLELEDLGQLPKEEKTEHQFKKFHDIYISERVLKTTISTAKLYFSELNILNGF